MFTDGQLQDASPGVSPHFFEGEILGTSPLLVLYVALNFVSGGLLTYISDVFESPVQSSPVHLSPVISDTRSSVVLQC